LFSEAGTGRGGVAAACLRAASPNRLDLEGDLGSHIGAVNDRGVARAARGVRRVRVGGIRAAAICPPVHVILTRRR